MEGYKTDGLMKPDEVAIGESNRFRVTEGELEDVATAEYGPDGKPRPVTVRQVLFGEGSGRHPMGLLSGIIAAHELEKKSPPGVPNRAARREDRKRQRKARKKARGR